MTPEMLVIKIVSEKTKNFWRANINVAILHEEFLTELLQDMIQDLQKPGKGRLQSYIRNHGKKTN